MSKTLKDLLTESSALEDKLVELAGELTPELEQSLILLELKLPEKVSRYMSLLDRLKMEAENLYTKAEKYESAAKALTALQERLTANIKQQMIANQLNELKGKHESFTLTKGKKAVNITNLSKVPSTFITSVITEKVDKDSIRVRLEEGDEIPGAELAESYVLRRKINKGIK